MCVFWYRTDVGGLVLHRTHTYWINLMDLFYHGITDSMNLALRKFEALPTTLLFLQYRLNMTHQVNQFNMFQLVAQSLFYCPVLRGVNVKWSLRSIRRWFIHYWRDMVHQWIRYSCVLWKPVSFFIVQWLAVDLSWCVATMASVIYSHSIALLITVKHSLWCCGLVFFTTHILK